MTVTGMAPVAAAATKTAEGEGGAA